MGRAEGDSLEGLLDALDSDLRAVGFIGTHKVLRLLKKIRISLEKDCRVPPGTGKGPSRTQEGRPLPKIDLE